MTEITTTNTIEVEEGTTNYNIEDGFVEAFQQAIEEAGGPFERDEDLPFDTITVEVTLE